MKGLTPAQLVAWTQAIVGLAGAGASIGNVLKGWLPQAHPTFGPDELAAAYDAIMADDLVRAALAEQASGQSPSA